MRVLGIETSCDETGVAIYDDQMGLLAHALHSQVALHQPYGGVVPELASRDHLHRMVPLVEQVMHASGSKPSDIGGIAYTAGPGLVGALLTGACFAKSLAMAWSIPSVAVHHMEGHLLAPMLEENQPTLPYVALLVSGGHTQLISVSAPGVYELLGESVDDAVGEAFDKTAKLLGLGYPGGPAISQLASGNDPGNFVFPRPMLDRPGLDFSFSGLKTAVLHAWNKADQNDPKTPFQIACAFELAVVETLVEKSIRAIKQTGFKTLVVAGGVSANMRLRECMSKELSAANTAVFYARPEFCTDNGAMIAYAGYQRLRMGGDGDSSIAVRARWPLSELPPLVNPQ